MDTTFSPGVTNGRMTIRDANGNVVRDVNGVPIQAIAMYLPRVASNVLQTHQNATVTKAEFYREEKPRRIQPAVGACSKTSQSKSRPAASSCMDGSVDGHRASGYKCGYRLNS